LVRPVYPLFRADFRNRAIGILTEDEQEWNWVLERYCQMLWIALSKVAILMGRSTGIGASVVSG